jgi:hypothetical protein
LPYIRRGAWGRKWIITNNTQHLYSLLNKNIAKK